MTCEQLFFLKRIVWITHRSRADNSRTHLAPQFVTKYYKSVFLSVNGIEVLHMVTFRTAVAVNASVTTAAIKVHIIVIAKPFRGSVFL